MGRATWSFADQGVVSLGNFLTQIILVRALAPADYGIFVLLYSVMLILNHCHAAVVTYPLSVHGAMSDLDRLRKLTTSSLALTAMVAVPQTPIVFGVALFLNRSALTWAMVVALAFWQIQETLRRALMSHFRHRGALPGDAVSYCGQALVLWYLSRHGALSLPVIFQVIAVTSVVAAAVQVAQLRPKLASLGESLGLLRPYWRLGKWNLFTNATDTATASSFPWILDLAQGPPEAASFQAVSNLLRVSHPVIFGVNNLIVPASSRVGREGGIRRAWRSALKSGAFGALFLLPYFLFLFFWPHLALSLAYGHASGYVGLTTPLRWFVLLYVFMYVFSVLGAFLNGVGHPSMLFAAEVVGAVCALAAGIPLTVRYGLVGACLGFFIVSLARTIASSFLVWRSIRSGQAVVSPLAQGTGQ